MLDKKPTMWEDRVSLFLAYLIDRGVQSSSIHSYVSAIKRVLVTDGYQWDDNKILLSTLTRSCRLVNDRVRTRLPIQCGLLEIILFEIKRKFVKQTYLQILYMALFSLGYYGLFRVGELCMVEDTAVNHTIKAENVHMGMNKDKILIVLISSKTHGEESYLQKIKITSCKDMVPQDKLVKRNFCPFDLLWKFFQVRYTDTAAGKPFFIFRDRSPVMVAKTRNLLRELLAKVGLDPSLYGMHSLRIEHATDMIKQGFCVTTVHRCGCWCSNTVFRYIRQ